MNKPTATKCIDGKKHSWKYLSQQSSSGYMPVYTTEWCRKCGCVTEFVEERKKKRKRCADHDGTPYIEIPDNLK